MQTESDESRCGTDFPSSRSTCPCHGLLSEKIRQHTTRKNDEIRNDAWSLCVKKCTLILLWSELISGLSLLLLSKCLWREERWWLTIITTYLGVEKGRVRERRVKWRVKVTTGLNIGEAFGFKIEGNADSIIRFSRGENACQWKVCVVVPTCRALPGKRPDSAALQTVLWNKEHGELEFCEPSELHNPLDHVPLITSIYVTALPVEPYKYPIKRFWLTALVSPHMQLLSQLRNHQKCSPALTFLWLEDVSKDVVTDIQNVLPLCSQQITHYVRGTWREKQTVYNQEIFAKIGKINKTYIILPPE